MQGGGVAVGIVADGEGQARGLGEGVSPGIVVVWVAGDDIAQVVAAGPGHHFEGVAGGAWRGGARGWGNRGASVLADAGPVGQGDGRPEEYLGGQVDIEGIDGGEALGVGGDDGQGEAVNAADLQGEQAIGNESDSWGWVVRPAGVQGQGQPFGQVGGAGGGVRVANSAAGDHHCLIAAGAQGQVIAVFRVFEEGSVVTQAGHDVHQHKSQGVAIDKVGYLGGNLGGVIVAVDADLAADREIPDAVELVPVVR